MNGHSPVEDIGYRAAGAVHDASAEAEAERPAVAVLQRRLRSRQNRRRLMVSAMAVTLLAGGLGVVVAIASGLRGTDTVLLDDGESPQAPLVARPSPEESVSAGADQEGGGEEPTVLHEPGAQSPAAVVGLPDGRLLVVGVTQEDEAAASRPAVWLSDDGQTWRRAHGMAGAPESGPDASTDVRMLDVATSEPADRLVAVGYSERSSNTQALSWMSTDAGETWEAVPLPGSRSRAGAVTRTDGRFVAVGAADGQPATWTSADGRSWALQTLPEEGLLVDVIDHADRLVALLIVGDSSQILVADSLSADAPVGWSVAESVTGSLSRLRADGDRLYALGTRMQDGLLHEGVLLSSRDGRTWDRDDRAWEVDGATEVVLHDIAPTSRWLVAVGVADGTARGWARPKDEERVTTMDLGPDAHVSSVIQRGEELLLVGAVERGDGADVAFWRWRVGEDAS
jgi:hypothetical protein